MLASDARLAKAGAERLGEGMSAARFTVARASSRSAPAEWRIDIRAGHHDLISDENPHLGGQDAGPAPYELLLAALSACTSITLRMYAARKEWPLERLEVQLRYVREGEADWVEREIVLRGPLSSEQKARLGEIAERTPVTLTLKGGVEIRTELREGS
jgi:putative redox protein